MTRVSVYYRKIFNPQRSSLTGRRTSRRVHYVAEDPRPTQLPAQPIVTTQEAPPMHVEIQDLTSPQSEKEDDPIPVKLPAHPHPSTGRVAGQDW
jgi:hypothetical protein